jgi:prophage antirepressor-like protein
MDFFLDIFNQLFTVNDKKIFIIFDIDGNIWFNFKDVLRVLGYTSTLKQSYIFNINKNYVKKYITFALPQSTGVTQNLHPKTLFINESGLYEVLSKSTKNLAKVFKDKYFKEIMPEIRKTGKYISKESDMKKIKKLNKTIDNYKAELNYYYDKFKFEPSEFGYLYICENNHIQHGISIPCFKIGYALDMRKRIKEYQVGNFTHKLLAYIPLQIDCKQIENCVKIRLKPHLTKLITDSICYISLSELKKDIIECINFE